MPNLPPPSDAALLRFAMRGRLAMRDEPPRESIVIPREGQESVWDFPRPPRVENVPKRVRVVAFGTTIADTTQALRVVETAGAPCYYLPPGDVMTEALRKRDDWTICEWKGIAFAYDIVLGSHSSRDAAWSYPSPLTDLGAGYERIAGYFAFYAARVESAWIGEEQVRPQGGGYYGGWITSNLTGPIKGDPGSGNW